MKTIYDIIWDRPGYYRAVSVGRIDQIYFKKITRLCDLDDHSEANWQRRKGYSVYRARSISDLPETEGA